jgi:hypothetical protein
MLATHVLSKGLLAEMLYLAYAISGSLCRFSLHFIKYADYVHHNVRYDDNFLMNNFNRLTTE